MTFEGFLIGMAFACFVLVTAWALGNVGISKHKKNKPNFDD